jgi:hypothetical protein
LDKIDLTNKIKTSVLRRNVQLASFKYLPTPLKKDLERTLKNAIIFYKQDIIKGSIKVINEKEIFLYKEKNLPEIKEGELILIILPYNEVKYIFQTSVEEISSDGYKLKILSPRHDKRLVLKTPVPAFISYIPHNLFLNFLQKNYYLVRNTNFSMEKVSELKDLQFYDLIFDERNQLDEEFKKAVNKNHVQGEIIDISSGGLCTKVASIIQIPENTHLLYTKFEITSKNGSIKSGLLCHLRKDRVEGKETFLHMSFLLTFKPEIWQKLEEIISPLAK